MLANATAPTCLLACFDFIASAYWRRGSSGVYVWFKLNVFAVTNNKGGRAVSVICFVIALVGLR
jgi:hypothetical protein